MERYDMYKYIDLFSGAGGLSYGFHQTNKFKLLCAVEKNTDAQDTFRHNLATKETPILGDIREFPYSTFIRKLKGKELDLLIGGPPCQGFSNANRQRNTLISGNNQLVKEYVKAVSTLKPRAFVMENVKTFESEKHFFFVSNNEEDTLNKLNVKISNVCVNICELTDDILRLVKPLRVNQLSNYYIRTSQRSILSDARILFRKRLKESTTQVQSKREEAN